MKFLLFMVVTIVGSIILSVLEAGLGIDLQKKYPRWKIEVYKTALMLWGGILIMILLR